MVKMRRTKHIVVVDSSAQPTSWYHWATVWILPVSTGHSGCV